MHAQSNVERDVLSKIHSTAVAILERSNAGSHISKPTPVLDTSSMTLDLNLTFPPDIIAPIMKLPEGIRRKLLCSFNNQLNELQEQFLSVFKSTCSMARNANELEAIRQGLRNVYYRRCISPLQLQLSRLPDISKHQPKNRSGKRTFNNEYTPLLEEYFEHNAYPCASDRSVLARKTMMTPRQIEVWFQNHRNRAKKEGKLIKRSSSNQALELSLKSFETDTSLFTVSHLASPEDSSSDDSVIEDFVSQPMTSSVDVFGCLAPPHAFPTCYPHNCADPFPNDNGIFRFAPPVWRRRPAAANLPPSDPVDFDEFVAMFASKLNLEGTVQNRRKTSLTKPWFAATVTIASRAPHPALLRQSCVSPLSQTIAPPTLVPSIQTSLRSRSSSVSPVSPPLSQIASKPRKLAPLPRQTPTTITPSSSRSTSTSSTTSSSSSLTDPIWSPSPVIQAQIPVITDDMFEAFHKYIDTKLQPRWNNPGFASTAYDKQGLPFSPYQSTTLLPISDLKYLEVQS